MHECLIFVDESDTKPFVRVSYSHSIQGSLEIYECKNLQSLF